MTVSPPIPAPRTTNFFVILLTSSFCCFSVSCLCPVTDPCGWPSHQGRGDRAFDGTDGQSAPGPGRLAAGRAPHGITHDRPCRWVRYAWVRGRSSCVNSDVPTRVATASKIADVLSAAGTEVRTGPKTVCPSIVISGLPEASPSASWLA